MVDKFSKETRSYVMSRIRGKDTKPEILVRSYLFSRGLRFRKNDKRYPGSPDIVLPKYKTIVFVHGCFWHLHEGCKYAKMPKSNVDYWKPKLYRNRERDACNKKELEEMGWTVITVWECELTPKRREKTLESLAFTLNHIWLQDHRTFANLYPELKEIDDQIPMAAEDVL